MNLCWLSTSKNLLLFFFFFLVNGTSECGYYSCKRQPTFYLADPTKNPWIVSIFVSTALYARVLCFTWFCSFFQRPPLFHLDCHFLNILFVFFCFCFFVPTALLTSRFPFLRERVRPFSQRCIPYTPLPYRWGYTPQ